MPSAVWRVAKWSDKVAHGEINRWERCYANDARSWMLPHRCISYTLIGLIALIGLVWANLGIHKMTARVVIATRMAECTLFTNQDSTAVTPVETRQSQVSSDRMVSVYHACRVVVDCFQGLSGR